MNVEDLCLEIFSYLSKNEVEKSELVSGNWYCYIKKGESSRYLSQKRVFSHLCLTNDTYRAYLPRSWGLFEKNRHCPNNCLNAYAKCSYSSCRCKYTRVGIKKCSQNLDCNIRYNLHRWKWCVNMSYPWPHTPWKSTDKNLAWFSVWRICLYS
jgi:hypothetical protein